MGMPRFDRCSASRIISDLGLASSNRKVAEHWLSLWRGDVLPARVSFSPSALKPFLRNLILFDVVPDRSVIVRLAGTTFRFVLDMELTGEDWIAFAPPEYRAERLRIFSDIAGGAIGRGVRSIELKSGKTQSCEEIILPFGADGDSPALSVLCHVDWIQDGGFMGVASREQALGAALAFETILLPLRKAA